MIHRTTQEPISISKLEQGDATLHGKKCFLSFDFQGSNKELLMAKHCQDKAIQHLDNLLAEVMSNQKDQEKILGELRSLVPGIPGSLGHFLVL
jgi:hypothetical protein